MTDIALTPHPDWCLDKLPEILRNQAARPRPGMAPLDWAEWLWVDAAYAAQMRLREALISDRPEAVLLQQPEAAPAANELRSMIVAALTEGRFVGPGRFEREGNCMLCPDGREVDLTEAPLEVIGRLLQADFCILTGPGAAARLTGAVLCFPSYWSLAEKAGHGLDPIHAPVNIYDDNLSRRVNRLFDALHPDRPLWRANLHAYDDPALFRPDPLRNHDTSKGAYLRSERQTLIRLPQSRAVVFGIHTVMASSDGG